MKIIFYSRKNKTYKAPMIGAITKQETAFLVKQHGYKIRLSIS